jgi:DNA polymerase-4
VGRVSAARLRKYGIETLKQIQDIEMARLREIMGKSAQWLFDRAWGIDNRPIRDNGPRIRKSISKDRTFMEDIPLQSLDPVYETIDEISNRIGKRLQSKQLYFRTVTVKIRFNDFKTIQRSHTITARTDNPAVIRALARQMFQDNLQHNRPIRQIGVKVSSLTPYTSQSNLAEFLRP